MKKEEVKSFYRALRDTDLATMETLVREYIGKRVSPITILNEGMIGAMGIIGQEFEVLLVARNMNKGIEILKPDLLREKAPSKGKFVIGTVKGDIHDIGKNLVTMMMAGTGYEVIDLGIDVPKDRFLEVIAQENPGIVGLSALLTTTMLEMKEIIKTIRQTFPQPPKVIIGGAPVTKTFADEIQTDGYAEDAVQDSGVGGSSPSKGKVIMNSVAPFTPKCRFLSGLFGGRKGDRISVANPTSIVSVKLMEKTGLFFPEAHLAPKKMAELAAGGYEILGFDSIMPEFSVQQEAEALGCIVDWGSPTMMPDAKTHPAKEVKDIQIPENFLEKPSIQVVLRTLEILRKNYGDHVALIGKVMGPWTLSYHLAGVQEFLLWTLTDPDKVRGFLDRLKEVTITFAKAQLQAGADAVVVADHAAGDLVGPKTYQDFLLPVHQEINQRIGGPTILHICGNCFDRLRLFVEARFDGYHFEWQVDAKMAVQVVNHEMS